MTNPFDDDNAHYVVVVNDEGRYSLWPGFIDIPAGWSVTGPAGKRRECLDWLDANWTGRPLRAVDAAAAPPHADDRPASLWNPGGASFPNRRS